MKRNIKPFSLPSNNDGHTIGYIALLGDGEKDARAKIDDTQG